MADFEPPSFSLGLDFDLDSPPPPPPSSTNPTAAADFETPTTSRTLKRLRRGPGPRSEPEMRCENGDDEIEEFSSQGDPCTGANMPPSSRPYSGCSTSKFSLHGHRVLTTQSTGKCKMARKEQFTDTPASTSMKANSNGFTFPKLTVSPLRKFQLLDSDSESDTDSDFDDPCANEYANIEANKVNSSSKAKLRNPVENPTMSRQKRANLSEGVSRGQDLWNDFYMEKRFTIPTPALDEVCEEYFQSLKNNRTDPPSRSVGNCSREIKGCDQTHIVIDDDEVHCNLGNPVPPANHYFYHDNPRVRNLVRSRLPYFLPLGTTHGRNQHTVPSAIDYMGQFNHGPSSRPQSQFNHGPSSKPQSVQKTNPGTSSKRVKKNSRKSNIEEVPEGSGSWVNPRSGISIPTDAGKRRVQAVGGQSAGYWFTSPEGKRVYISKAGQELTGRAAYTHYRKESGKGFKKSGGKKKCSWKKKRIGNKKAAANKR